MSTATYLQLADWRRTVGELYARVRASRNPSDAHAVWRSGRDRLFRDHPQSPLPESDPLRSTGLPYWDYDPALRLRSKLYPPGNEQELAVETGEDGTTSLRLIGEVALGEPVNSTLDVWWLHQYGGGLFIPVRDGTAGTESYAGGRYLFDTAKGADLGGIGGDPAGSEVLIIDLNFLYHPSCRYNPLWICPLAPHGNIIGYPVRGGERLDLD
jgi:uncharacterized protein